jgi:hypothetical protein
VDLQDALIALAFGFFVILIVVPIVALTLLSLVDVFARIDIGASKAVWAGLLLFVPLLGLAMYWLVRPRDYNPYDEGRRELVLLGYRSYEFAEGPVSAVPSRPMAQPRMTPALQGGADPEPADQDDAGTGF